MVRYIGDYKKLFDYMHLFVVTKIFDEKVEIIISRGNKEACVDSFTHYKDFDLYVECLTSDVVMPRLWCYEEDSDYDCKVYINL